MLERAVRAADHVQQRSRVLGFAVAVQKKFGDDNGGGLVTNLAYSGFVSVFPLLLVLVTVLGIVAGHDSSFARSIERSVLSQFPIIGTDLQNNVHALHRATVPGLVFGLAGLTWGATGLSQTGLYAMAQVWNVPGVLRPGFLARVWRSFAFLALLGTGVSVAGLLSGYGLLGRHTVLAGAASELASVIATSALYLAGLRVLTTREVPWRLLVPGSVVGGIAWTALEAAGGELVARGLRHESAVYGLFAIVLGLLAWIYLGARISMYAAEINAVLAFHLWPRSIAPPPLTSADRRALRLVAQQSERRPGERVSVSFADAPATPDGDAAPRDEGAALRQWRAAGLDHGTEGEK
ncbi:MAG TPA: YhjD/YihY/BrkB family envelope integrity protein [Acidimicrobiales bacterium]|nr:YhjD/YihY/BrkB family envelope integrity protein [Acidimicrobiales bacterium]